MLGVQNVNFALKFSQNERYQPQILISGRILSNKKKIFSTIFRQPKILEGNCPFCLLLPQRHWQNSY